MKMRYCKKHDKNGFCEDFLKKGITVLCSITSEIMGCTYWE